MNTGILDSIMNLTYIYKSWSVRVSDKHSRSWLYM